MIRYLQEPFPLHRNNRADISFALGTGVFIGWFLVTFQPNGTDDWQHPNKYPFLWGYGAVITSILLIMRLLVPPLIPGVFQESRWTVAKHILYLLISFTLALAACYLYYSWFFAEALRWKNLLGFGMVSSTIAVFPLTAYVMISYIRQLKKYQEGAANFNSQNATITESKEMILPPIQLLDEQGKVQLVLNGDAIFFLQSSLNYVEVFYQQEDQLKKELIRISFQKIQEQLPEYLFIRCHRSYIINLQKVASVSGNAQGYKLHLNAHDLIIPVSRSKSKVVLAKLG